MLHAAEKQAVFSGSWWLAECFLRLNIPNNSLWLLCLYPFAQQCPLLHVCSVAHKHGRDFLTFVRQLLCVLDVTLFRKFALTSSRFTYGSYSRSEILVSHFFFLVFFTLGSSRTAALWQGMWCIGSFPTSQRPKQLKSVFWVKLCFSAAVEQRGKWTSVTLVLCALLVSFFNIRLVGHQ